MTAVEENSPYPLLFTVLQKTFDHVLRIESHYTEGCYPFLFFLLTPQKKELKTSKIIVFERQVGVRICVKVAVKLLK